MNMINAVQNVSVKDDTEPAEIRNISKRYETYHILKFIKAARGCDAHQMKAAIDSPTFGNVLIMSRKMFPCQRIIVVSCPSLFGADKIALRRD